MRVELIIFFSILAALLFLQIRKNLNSNKPETGKQQPERVKTEKKKRGVGWIVLVILLLFVAFWGYKHYNEKVVALQTQTAMQVYANYTFPKDAVQIDVRLLPEKQLLSREAGGWVITPAGSNFRIDYDVPIAIEYIDGKKFYRQPGTPVDDGVNPSKQIFRLYKVGGGSGIAKVTIKRDVF